jgi:hypothetical protein
MFQIGYVVDKKIKLFPSMLMIKVRPVLGYPGGEHESDPLMDKQNISGE